MRYLPWRAKYIVCRVAVRLKWNVQLLASVDALSISILDESLHDAVSDTPHPQPLAASGHHVTLPGSAGFCMSVTTRSFLDQLCAAGLISQADLTRVNLSGSDAGAAATSVIHSLAGAHLLNGFQAQRAESHGFESLLVGDYVVVDQLEDREDRQRYKARCTKDGSEIALHVFPPSEDATSHAGHPQGEHPYVATVLATGLSHDRRFVATQLIEGEDLQAVVQQCGPLPLEDAIVCVSQAAQGLGWLYSQHAPPRDIGPQHVLLDEAGNARVLSCELYYGRAAALPAAEADGAWTVATITALRSMLYYLLTGTPQTGVTLDQLLAVLENCETSLDLSQAQQLVEKLEAELQLLFQPQSPEASDKTSVSAAKDTTNTNTTATNNVDAAPATGTSGGLLTGVVAGGVLLTLLIAVIAAILWAF